VDRCLSPMGAPEIIMARRQIEIDRDKLRAAIRQLPHEYVFYMLGDAIDLLPPARLHKIVRKYLDLRHSTSSSASWIASTSAGKASSFSQTRRGPGRSVSAGKRCCRRGSRSCRRPPNPKSSRSGSLAR
jgi:hypothetical protein